MFDSISDLLLAHNYNINAEAQAFQKMENWVNYNIPFADIQNHTVQSFAKLAILKGLLPEDCLTVRPKVETQTNALLTILKDQPIVRVGRVQKRPGEIFSSDALRAAEVLYGDYFHDRITYADLLKRSQGL